MQKIPRKALDALADISQEVGDLFNDLDTLGERFAEEAQAIIEKIGEAKEAAREIMDDAAMDAESYYDEQSEKWQEGNRGQAYSEWKDRLREVADAIADDTEAPEVQMPDRPDWVDSIGDPDFSEFEY